MQDALAVEPHDVDDLTMRREGDEAVLLVKGVTSPHKLAGALLGAIKEPHLRVVARAIGAGAVNQAVKGCAIAQTLSGQNGLPIHFSLEFTPVTIRGEARSAISLVVIRSPER